MQHLFKVLITQIHATQSPGPISHRKDSLLPSSFRKCPHKNDLRNVLLQVQLCTNHIRCVKSTHPNVRLVLHWVHKKAFSSTQFSRGEQLLNEQFKRCCVSLLIQFRVVLAARLIFELSLGSSGNLAKKLLYLNAVQKSPWGTMS